MKRLSIPAVLLVLAACQNAPPRYSYQPPPPPPSAPMQPYKGPQAQQPPRVKPAMPNYGGTAGPLSAKNVGAYMDGLERDLRHYLRGIPVARPGDVVVLNLKSDDMFEKSSLSEDGRDLLRNLSAALRHYDRTSVQVTGFTDTRGTPDKNLETSQKR